MKPQDPGQGPLRTRRSALHRPSVAPSPFVSTYASSPPPIRTLKKRSPRGTSAKISSTGSTWFHSLCRPSRERKQDIPLLAGDFLTHFGRQYGRPRMEIASEEGLETLAQYHWPGNVRELKNVIERVLIPQSPRPPHRTQASAAADSQSCPLPLRSSQLFSRPATPTSANMRSLKKIEEARNNVSRAAELLGPRAQPSLSQDESPRHRHPRIGLAVQANALRAPSIIAAIS